MESDATVPSRVTGMPVKELAVEIIDGPDRGLSAITTESTISVGTADDNALVLSDRKVSRYHLELRRRHDRIELTDLGSTNGTWVGPLQLVRSSGTIEPDSEVRLGASLLRVSDGQTVVVDTPVREGLGPIIGRSDLIQRVMETVVRLSPKDVPVLLFGESGTGKELVARALHDLSPRSEGPFVTLDCGAVAPTLFASELFGHERGAFTGAERTHAGAFERAHGGTLFLDEIGELPPEQQAALLGVLERRRFRRVGGIDEVPVDVRVVSATHRDLRAEVNRNAFRLDLYYRLAVVLLPIPPLRERREDVVPLIEHFLREEGSAATSGEVFDDDALDRLKAHSWPGNVRELRNTVLAALAYGEAPQIQEVVVGEHGDDLGRDLVGGVLELSYRKARRVVTDEFERRYGRRLLERAEGNVRQAAKLAKMDRGYLTELLKRHKLR